MKTTLAVTAAFAAFVLSAPSFAATDAECDTMWKSANKSGGATLTDAEAARYAAAMRVREYKWQDGAKIDRATFVAACKADIYAPRKTDNGAPLKGANSFTEGQAKDRAMAHGFADVSALKKDADGIWRGTASMDGKSGPLAVDFKGNVVAK